MNLWEIFFSALFFENLFVWNAIGLGGLVLFSYTLSESVWVSIRFIIFLLLQTIIMILIRPFFDFPGKELFLLITLIGIEVILSIIIDIFLPLSHLDDGIGGFVRRGDAILPMVFSTIIIKKYPPVESIVFSLGTGLGFAIVLMMITAISIRFNFYRLHSRHMYALKLVILGVLALVCY